MKKRLLILLILVSLVVAIVALPACSEKDDAIDVSKLVDPDDVTPDIGKYVFFDEQSDHTYAVSARADFDMPERLVFPAKYNGKAVTSIEGHGFKNKKTIKEVVIPSPVNKISLSAFYGCASLTTVTIPTSVKTMEYLAFYGCHELKTVIYQGTKAQWKSITDNGAFSYDVTILCTDGTIKQ